VVVRLHGNDLLLNLRQQQLRFRLSVAGDDYEIIRHNAAPSYMIGRVRLSEQKVKPLVVKKNAFAYVLWLRMRECSRGLHVDTFTAADQTLASQMLDWLIEHKVLGPSDRERFLAQWLKQKRSH